MLSVQVLYFQGDAALRATLARAREGCCAVVLCGGGKTTGAGM
jgi:hypothetical protein